jgi:hypothetical protein
MGKEHQPASGCNGRTAGAGGGGPLGRAAGGVWAPAGRAGAAGARRRRQRAPRARVAPAGTRRAEAPRPRAVCHGKTGGKSTKGAHAVQAAQQRRAQAPAPPTPRARRSLGWAQKLFAARGGGGRAGPARGDSGPGLPAFNGDTWCATARAPRREGGGQRGRHGSPTARVKSVGLGARRVGHGKPQTGVVCLYARHARGRGGRPRRRRPSRAGGAAAARPPAAAPHGRGLAAWRGSVGGERARTGEGKGHAWGRGEGMSGQGAARVPGAKATDAYRVEGETSPARAPLRGAAAAPIVWGGGAAPARHAARGATGGAANRPPACGHTRAGGHNAKGARARGRRSAPWRGAARPRPAMG